jgi:5-methylcytosine-specific restriction endonuclease McrA
MPPLYSFNRPCTQCGQKKPITEFSFRRKGASRHPWCKECVRTYHTKHRRTPQQKAKDQAYRDARKEKQVAYDKARRQGPQREQILSAKKKWGKQRRETDPEGARAYGRKKYREYYERDPEKMRLRAVRRRAAPGHCSKEQFLAKCEYWGWRCYLCLSPVTRLTVQIEHRIPITRGGTHWPANIAPACRACNHQKGAQTETEYRKTMRGIGSVHELAKEALHEIFG